jgi:predicted membrane-bound spermidine synthase
MFFCSGLSSLIYQVIWIRQLALAVGSTSASMSLVLSIFFLGLALGSYWVGKSHSRIINPIRVYGLLEGFIGIYSAILVYVLFHFQTLLISVYPGGEIQLFSQILKFIFVFILLIFPTLAMGATLPLLIKAFELLCKDIQLQKNSVGFMYGINTLGAVGGSFISGFLLIPWIGIEYSNHFAVLINFLLFFSALLLGRKLNGSFKSKASDTSKPQTHKLSSTKPITSYRSAQVYLFIAATCGFATISAEVVWSKYLGIFMGTNIYGLSLILSIFLLGIGLGSLFLPYFQNKKIFQDEKLFLLSLLFLLIASLWIATLLLGSLPLVSTLISYYIQAKLSLLQIKFIATGLILFLPTFISGMILPFLIQMLNDEINDLPLATGAIYSINTIGSIAGSYLSGVILIPIIGSAWTLKIALNLLLASFFIAFAFAIKNRAIVRKIQFAICGFGFLLFAGVNGTENLHYRDIIRSAYHQSYNSISKLSDILKIFSDQQEEFIKVIEGETAVISLSHDQADGVDYKKYFRLKTNGLNESVYDSLNKDALPKYEALLGLLPYLLVENPENAFLVGYGGGYSAHFFGTTDLKKVVVAELEKGIIKAADHVWQGDNPILKHKNIELKIEDARFLLAVGNGAPYDIIASQPSHSWLSGVANLFTLEYFELVKSRLKPKGIFSQWLNLYNINEEVLKSILKTFYTVFPNGAIFTGLQDDEIILIGSIEKLKFPIEKVNALIQSPQLNPLLQNLYLTNAYDILTHMTLTRADIMRITQEAPLNTDRNAFAETRQSKLFYNPQDKQVQQFLDSQFTGAYEEIFAEDQNSEIFWTHVLDSLNRWQNYTKYNKVIDRKKEFIKNQFQLAQAYYQMERYASARKLLFDQQGQIKISNTQELNFALLILAGSEDYLSAIKTFLQNSHWANQYSYCQTLENSLMIKNLNLAKKTTQKIENNWALSQSQCGDYLYYYLGHYYFKAGQNQKAINYFDHFIKQNPSYTPATKYFIGSLIASDMNPSAFAFMESAQASRTQELARLQSLRDYYYQIKADEDAKILDQKIKLF